MNDNRLERLLAASTPDGFAPGFSDRVMHRLRAEQAVPVFAVVLARRFRQMAAIALLLIVGLGVYNMATPPVAGDPSPLEDALGVPPLTVETAYMLEIDE